MPDFFIYCTDKQPGDDPSQHLPQGTKLFLGEVVLLSLLNNDFLKSHKIPFRKPDPKTFTLDANCGNLEKMKTLHEEFENITSELENDFTGFMYVLEII